MWKLIRCSVVCVLLAVCLPACGSAVSAEQVIRDASVAANLDASIVEALQGSAYVVYRFEQERARGVALELGEGRDATRARVLAVRAQWEPVWSAFDAARAAHAALVALLQDAGASRAAIDAARSASSARMLELRTLVGLARARAEGTVL
jgi:hypothetical protein